MAKQEEYVQKEIENLGKRIRAVRKELGYGNLDSFAYENDIHRAQFGRYEQGEDMRFSSLLKVLKAMDMSLADFFSEGFSK